MGMSAEMNAYSPEELEAFNNFWNGQLEDERKVSRENDPFAQRCEVRAFVSYSNGRGRGERSARQVILIRNKISNEVAVYNPESSDADMWDDIAANIYEGCLTSGEDPYTVFRERVEQEVQEQLFSSSR